MFRVALGLMGAGVLAVSAQAPQAADSAAAGRAFAIGRVVADDTGDPIRNARVTLSRAAKDAPVECRGYLRRDSTGQDGTFRTAGLPAGTCFAAVAVVPSDDDDACQDPPQFLESLVPGATIVTIVEGFQARLALSSRGR